MSRPPPYTTYKSHKNIQNTITNVWFNSMLYIIYIYIIIIKLYIYIYIPSIEQWRWKQRRLLLTTLTNNRDQELVNINELLMLILIIFSWKIKNSLLVTALHRQKSRNYTKPGQKAEQQRHCKVENKLEKLQI